MHRTDELYNAYFTDSSGNVVGGCVDYFQPNVWLFNNDTVLNCLFLKSLYDNLSVPTCTEVPCTKFPLITYSGSTYNIDVCHSKGAIYPYSVTTITKGPVNVTSTTLYYAVEKTLTLSYGTIAYASGDFVRGNLTLDSTNKTLSLDFFRFLIADWSTSITAGLGLGSTTDGLGLMSYLQDKGLVLGNGYSVFYAPTTNDTEGHGLVICGGVDESLYSGDFYVFPRVHHTLPSAQIFPIVVLTLATMLNLETGDSRIIHSSNCPVVFDSRLHFSYLPTDLILNLAIQTNAEYNNVHQRWIVLCVEIWNTNAAILFDIGPLSIKVPLESMIMKVKNLYYSNGDEACSLEVLPISSLGYAAFGVNILSHVYMAVDYINGSVAVAQANTDVIISSGTVIATSHSKSNNTTFGLITSGTIPFATTVTLQPDVTFTFFLGNVSLEANMPARFSGSLFLSGSLFISDHIQSTSTSTSSRTHMSGALSTFRPGSCYVLAGYILLGVIGVGGFVVL
ncbi:acid protease [Metschnikowia bicuspidata]|uniref:Acid protease n=1 Tax=Metschnikowia bicuspidata TaxID=27322 RepID=A0A4P9ZHX0_9ASCO|nr:acid protease [Metschnikowia bicuspidata]